MKKEAVLVNISECNLRCQRALIWKWRNQALKISSHLNNFSFLVGVVANVNEFWIQECIVESLNILIIGSCIFLGVPKSKMRMKFYPCDSNIVDSYNNCNVF